MRKQLDGLRWESCWMSQLGCLKACLGALGVEISWPRLYGLTAHAFIVNVHETVCPSGPTAWRSAELVGALLPHLGAQVEFVLGDDDNGSLAEAQANGWEMARRYLNADLPVYGWELVVPEYYVISGFDQTGYLYTGPACPEVAGPKPWRELGQGGTGAFLLAGLKPCAPSSLKVALTDAIETAVRFADPEDPWSHESYARGPAAFDVWAEALENGTADDFGHRYNAAVWAESRHAAAQFLHELVETLAGEAAEAADEALTAYRRVSNLLGAVSAEHVFLTPEHFPEGQTLQDAESAHMLRQAAKAEAEGMAALQRLTEALSG